MFNLQVSVSNEFALIEFISELRVPSSPPHPRSSSVHLKNVSQPLFVNTFLLVLIIINSLSVDVNTHESSDRVSMSKLREIFRFYIYNVFNTPSNSVGNTVRDSLLFGPGGCYLEIWVGVCGPPLETLILFQTKICAFPYPISDLMQNFVPYFRPDPYPIPFV